MHVSIGNSKLTAAEEKNLLVQNQNIVATCFQRVKRRLTVSNVYSQQSEQFTLVDRRRTCKHLLTLLKGVSSVELSSIATVFVFTSVAVWKFESNESMLSE